MMDRKKMCPIVSRRAGRKDGGFEDDENNRSEEDYDLGKFRCSQCDGKFDTFAARVEHFSKEHLRHSAVRLQTFSRSKQGQTALNDGSGPVGRVEVNPVKQVCSRNQAINGPFGRAGKGKRESITKDSNNNVSQLEGTMKTFIGEKTNACPYCPIRFLLPETKEKHITAVHPEMLPVQPGIDHSLMETEGYNGDKTKTTNLTDLVDNLVIPTLPESSERSSATRTEISFNKGGEGTGETEKTHRFECFMCPIKMRKSEDLKKHLKGHQISEEVSSALISSFYQPSKNRNNTVTMKIEPDDEIIFLGEVRNCDSHEMQDDADRPGEEVGLLSHDFFDDPLNQWQQSDENMVVDTRKDESFPCIVSTQSLQDGAVEENLSSNALTYFLHPEQEGIQISNDVSVNVTEVSTEVVNKAFQCSWCPKRYSHRRGLHRHVVTKHPDQLPKFRKTRGRRKKSVVTKTAKFQKEQTPSETPRDNKTDDQRSGRPGNEPLRCALCPDVFREEINLQDHLVHLHKLDENTCNVLSSTMITEVESSKKELNISNGVKERREKVVGQGSLCPRCDVCGRNFSHLYALTRHRRIHTGEKPFSCPVCNMQFYRDDYLKRHMKRDHSVPGIISRPQRRNLSGRLFHKAGSAFKETAVVRPIEKFAETHAQNEDEVRYKDKLASAKPSDSALETKNSGEQREDSLIYNCFRCDLKFGRLQKLKAHLHSVHRMSHVEVDNCLKVT